MAAPDPRDPWYQPMPLQGPPAPKRVAYVEAPDAMPVAEPVRAALRAAAKTLRPAGYQVEPDFKAALARLQPDLVNISTYSDSHADYAIAAMEAGAHVFVEKPLATTVADAKRVADCARRTGKKVVVGYILRHHPSWMRLIAEARALRVAAPPLARRLAQTGVVDAAPDAPLLAALSSCSACGETLSDVVAVSFSATMIALPNRGVAATVTPTCATSATAHSAPQPKRVVQRVERVSRRSSPSMRKRARKKSSPLSK